jgi:hypothetical protein
MINDNPLVLVDQPCVPDCSFINDCPALPKKKEVAAFLPLLISHCHVATSTASSFLVATMEVLGFVATVITIAEVGKTTSKFAKTIYAVAKESRFVGDRIRKCGRRFDSIADSIATVHIAIEHHCPSDPASPTIQYIKSHQVLENLRRISDEIRDDIRGQTAKIRSLPHRFDIVTSWKWKRMEPELEALHPHMESLKTELSIILNVLILEATISRKRKEGDEAADHYEKRM